MRRARSHRRVRMRLLPQLKSTSSFSRTPSVGCTQLIFSRRATTSTSCERCEHFFIAPHSTHASSHCCAPFSSRSFGQSTASPSDRQEVCSSDAHLALQYLSGHFSAVRSLVKFFTKPTY